MEFYRRSRVEPDRDGYAPRRVGILAGSFNPPTIAHRELAHCAQFEVDELLCVAPSVLPHKPYFGANLEQRLWMLAHSELPEPFSIAASERGLFVDIAGECRVHYGESTELYFLCGADAAERILTWDYGRPGAVDEMLWQFSLLVAPRAHCAYVPPARFESRIRAMPLGEPFQMVSSTEVRERIRSGMAWEHLVPAGIVELARQIYA